MTEQMEIPAVPPVGHLAKLRGRLLPVADDIIRMAKGAEVTESNGGRLFVGHEDMKGISRKRRELDRRMDALGVPHRSVVNVADFPEGTRDAARASGEFFVAMESAMSAIGAVMVAEKAAYPDG